MKTPNELIEEICANVLAEHRINLNPYMTAMGQIIEEMGNGIEYETAIQSIIEEAIKADRAQRDGLADGTGRFTAEFDKYAWASATVEAREEWINRAVDALNGEVYVTKVEVGQ